MTMKNHMQSLGTGFAVTLCVVLAAGQGVAQHAPTPGSDRDVPRVEGGGIGGDVAIKGDGETHGIDLDGDRGSANRSRTGDAGHKGASAHDGSGIDTSRRGAAPANAPGIAPPSPDAGANTDLGPIRLEGATGLQRRANRKALIANAPKIPGRPVSAIGIATPLTPFGANRRTRPDTAAATPGLPSSMPGAPSLGHSAPDLRTSVATGTSALGITSTGVTGAGATGHHQNLPANAPTVALPHAAVINGTTMSHIASGPGYLGGPAKDRSGINGTAIRPKH